MLAGMSKGELLCLALSSAALLTSIGISSYALHPSLHDECGTSHGVPQHTCTSSFFSLDHTYLR